MGLQSLLADAELRVLLGRVALRAARAPNSLGWIKQQLRRVLDELDEDEARANRRAPPATAPARHIKDR